MKKKYRMRWVYNEKYALLVNLDSFSLIYLKEKEGKTVLTGQYNNNTGILLDEYENEEEALKGINEYIKVLT